jgi:hypothetical protein
MRAIMLISLWSAHKNILAAIEMEKQEAVATNIWESGNRFNS